MLVIARIGAGGMGEVYSALDTRLDRTVALKVLSPALTADETFRERFTREARAIARLNHPNICSVYDAGAAQASSDPRKQMQFLAMEYLDGETLAVATGARAAGRAGSGAHCQDSWRRRSTRRTVRA